MPNTFDSLMQTACKRDLAKKFEKLDRFDILNCARSKRKMEGTVRELGGRNIP